MNSIFETQNPHTTHSPGGDMQRASEVAPQGMPAMIFSGALQEESTLVSVLTGPKHRFIHIINILSRH
jgi:hypothetical protein